VNWIDASGGRGRCGVVRQSGSVTVALGGREGSELRAQPMGACRGGELQPCGGSFDAGAGGRHESHCAERIVAVSE
jgi:hypothetical protein